MLATQWQMAHLSQYFQNLFCGDTCTCARSRARARVHVLSFPLSSSRQTRSLAHTTRFYLPSPSAGPPHATTHTHIHSLADALHLPLPPLQDNRSWLHVNWYEGGGVIAQGFGVVNAPQPLDPLGMSSSTYALEVANASVVEVLLRHATVDTDEPFLMYLTQNVTFWPRGDWPQDGIAFLRPVVMIGWSDEVTGIDFGNCAGCASLTGRWSNVTFDSLSLENLGYGDPTNPNTTSYSIISSTNIWFFNATRWGLGG